MGQLTNLRTQSGELVGGRYRVEAALGRGGMAEVLQVRDGASGDRVALKRLIRPSKDRLAARLFEREYHTLASLRHPRIIHVYEYGHSPLGPFYTMELLPGGDLRDLSPLPYAQACRYLGDVASSLTLLHARRLLHRDLNPRNVRVTERGYCKVIDFGALATFGSQREIVGAPSCVAPEALHGLPLDQRSDLYALGTLAYYLLTGRSAFPARRIEELEDKLGQEPRAPSQLCSGAIPASLDELVMSLLSRDPSARPSSAAEVLDQLSQIVPLESPPLPEIAHGYLAGGRLVGRERELRSIETAVAHCSERKGGACLLIAGAPGVGKTRLLTELALQAQLSGAVVGRSDAVGQGGPYGVVRELIARLFEVLPDDAFEAGLPHADLLARFAPQLAAHVENAGEAHDPAETPGELRKRTQVALREWFLTLAAAKRIALVVDDLEHCDEASLALLERLARESKQCGLLLCATVEEDALARGTPALRSFALSAQVLRPAPLDAEQTRELLAALFGAVPNVQRLACFAYDRSSGLPQRIHALSETLIASRVVRVFDGIWVIPSELEGHGLDLRGDSALAEARLAQLSPAARAGAELFCLQRGALALELWLGLAESDAHACGRPVAVRALFAALDELIGAGLVVGSAAGLRFSGEWLRVYVEATLGPERAARLHRELARLLLETGDSGASRQLEAGFHLLRGGDLTRGADLLGKLGIELVRCNDETPAAAPALEAALAIYEQEGRPLHERCALLGPLALAGYRVDLRLAEAYGERAIDQQERLIGLALARALRPLLGARCSLGFGLAFGLLRSLWTHGARGARAFREAIGLFTVTCNAVAGTAATCLDALRAWRAARAVEPLSWLGRDHVCNVAHRYQQALALLAEDRQAESARLLREVIDALESRPVRDLPPNSRQMFLGGALYALGVLESLRDSGEALALADRLEAIGLRVYDPAADQIRAMHHANRGEFELSEEYRKRVELHSIDLGSSWQFELWAPCAALNHACMLRDVLLLKSASERLEPLAARVPSLGLYLQLAQRGHRSLRGEPHALDEYEAWLRALPPRSFNGWASSIAMLGYMRNQRGEHERARALCAWALAQLGPEDLAYTALTLKLEVNHALALAGLGKLDAALAELDRLLARDGHGAGPLALGFLHEQLARVSALAGDGPRVREHVEVMTRSYEATGDAGLIALAARMRALSPSLWPSRPSRPDALAS